MDMATSPSLLDRLTGAPTEDDWRRLDELYRPLLHRSVARAGVPASDVDDLVQEVLSVVARRIAGFEWRGRGAFRAWLRMILVNEVRRYFRDRKYQPIATGERGILDGSESQDSALSKRWDREHDKHVLASLMQRVQGDFAPTTWQAFRRHVLEGEPAGQVAEALGLTVNSVLLAKSRVLKQLREEAAGLVD
jgi:RNA polymerase sigma-70 factor (ECF subfamily)